MGPVAGHRHEQWLEFVETLGTRLFALAGAADRIGKQYFGGRSPLLPDSRASINSLVTQLEGMIELYNDRLLDGDVRTKRGRVRKVPAPINVAARRKGASAATTALVHELVTAAKAEALVMMGERKQACDLMNDSFKLG